MRDRCSVGKLHNVRQRAAGAIAALGCVTGMPAEAQQAAANYPAKAIRVIVPFGPGGPTDFLVRTIGQKLTESWGQQLIVDHRTGANGVVGAELTARAAPDGYTLGMATNGTHGINAALFSKLPYDTVRDFAPVTRLGLAPYLLIAHPSLPARGVKELLALARARPGEITWSCGGSPSQLAAELFKKTAGVNVIVVPYKGNAPAVTAAMSGEVSLSFGNVAQSVPQVKAGRLRALGVGSLQRSAVMPDVPTVRESLPGFPLLPIWGGYFGPAGMPAPILSRWNAEMVKALTAPDVTGKLEDAGMIVVASSPQAFAACLFSVAIGIGMSNPCLSSLASKGASASNRGRVMGLYQSGGSLARILGPPTAGFLFDRFGRHAEVDQETAHVPRLALLGRPVMVVVAAADDDLGCHAALVQAGRLPQPVGRRCQRRVGIVGQFRPRDRPAQHDNCIVAAGLGRPGLGKSLPLERPDQHVGNRRRREHEQLNDSEDGN